MSQSKSKPRIAKSSSCLCSSVKLTVTGTDKSAVLCHCSNCQKASGSAFAHNYRLTNAELKFDAGEDLVKEYLDSQTMSGNTSKRHFCSQCGSPLYLTNAAFKGLVILNAGTMQDRTQPFMELFKENKYHWIGEVTGKAKL